MKRFGLPAIVTIAAAGVLLSLSCQTGAGPSAGRTSYAQVPSTPATTVRTAIPATPATTVRAAVPSTPATTVRTAIPATTATTVRAAAPVPQSTVTASSSTPVFTPAPVVAQQAIQSMAAPAVSVTAVPATAVPATAVPASASVVPLFVPAKPAPLSTLSIPARPPAGGTGNGPFFVTDGISYVARTEGKAFSIYSQGAWKKTFLKGVNIGAAKPGFFPGELAISKEEYLRWFRQIAEMNADVIRVYTTMMPQFYDALLEYNSQAAKPLWVLHGVWLAEELISKHKTAWAEDGLMLRQFTKDARDLVDIIHGNKTLPVQPGFASGNYKSDVSRWIVGWIMGIEWDPYFIADTDAEFPEKNVYKGRFLSTEGASPFETFLCRVCDETEAYEVDKYKMMRPIAVNNWPTADPIKHPNEPYEMEDICTLNIEHIKQTTAFHAGWFASFHIYPYYPDFINFDLRYTRFYDDDARVNTYRAYIREIMSLYTVPVLVAEFGVPASRGMAHRAPYSGYNQGMHSETEQGEIDVHLMRDIYNEGYCGALVFIWQDEWFKRTWNNMDLDVPDARPFWSNYQTNEQNFGILAFDPGAAQTVCQVDGDISEWKDNPPIAAGTGISIHAQSDERYLYLMASVSGFRPDRDTLVFALDTVSGQGNTTIAGTDIKFSHPADFIVRINRKDNSRVLVDAYYDPYYYLYGVFKPYLPKVAVNSVKGSGVFNPVMLALSRQVKLPETKVIIPFSGYETGLLRFGDSNPASPNHDSLADYYARNDAVEVRIPWQILNVMNPAQRKVMADLYVSKGIKEQESGEWRIGAGVLKNGATGGISIGMRSWTLPGWKMPTYHERLKESYYILRDAFRDWK